ncbi:hypothetical protein C3L33_09855, partial [Rhododendron williamsianum]
MTGEEVVGRAGPKLVLFFFFRSNGNYPKLVRLLYFVGAGYICTAAINKWRDIQLKSFQLPEKPSNAVQKAVE